MESTYRKKKRLNKIGGVSDSDVDSLKTRYVSTYSSYMTSKKNHEIKKIGFRDLDIKKAGYAVPRDAAERKKLIIKINTSIERAQIENAKNAIAKLKTQIEKLRTTINESIIKSPISGVVALRGVEHGEMIKQDTDLFVVMKVRKVYLIASVNEKDSGSMARGQKALFTVDALSEKKFNGRVAIVSPLLDKETRTLEVRILTPNYNAYLRPGMFARGSVEVKTIKDMVAIPDSAVYQNNGRYYVYLIKNNAAYKKEIIISGTYGSTLHVKNGLKENDHIAAEKIRLLYDGAPVKIKIDDGKK